jgi:hypothetical protein
MREAAGLGDETFSGPDTEAHDLFRDDKDPATAYKKGLSTSSDQPKKLGAPGPSPLGTGEIADPNKPGFGSHDTVGAVALDGRGNLAAATSTGGTLNKTPGRVGDSSLIGCGCYADNLAAAVSLTGWGEPIMKLVLGKWTASPPAPPRRSPPAKPFRICLIASVATAASSCSAPTAASASPTTPRPWPGAWPRRVGSKPA